MLFLHDASSNELWTQRDDAKVIQVPGSLGIAGATPASYSTVLVDDVHSDSRFHAMVDQFVLAGLRHDALQASAAYALDASRATKPVIALFSSALLAHDGAVLGVLQIAVPTALLPASKVALYVRQTQLFGKLCCFYVEQMLHEVVRSSPDRVRARVPDRFIRLFKQTKNWRKYYVALERRTAQVEERLAQVDTARETLAAERDDALNALARVRSRLDAHKRSETDVARQVATWKTKMSRLKALAEAHERALESKSREVDDVTRAFARFRRQQRAKGLQSLLGGGDDITRTTGGGKRDNDNDSRSTQSLLRADNAALRNQLVRAESDSVVLVQAIDVACKRRGDLPEPMRLEVQHIAQRLEATAKAAAVNE